MVIQARNPAESVLFFQHVRVVKGTLGASCTVGLLCPLQLLSAESKEISTVHDMLKLLGAGSGVHSQPHNKHLQA